MAPTTKEGNHIIVLGIVIFILPISSTLLQDSHQVRFKQHSKQQIRGANQAAWISFKQPCRIDLHSDGIPVAISSSDTISVTTSDTISEYTKAIYKAIPNCNPETVPESNLVHSHRSTLHKEGGLWQWLGEAVGEHLSSRYVAQFDPSFSIHTCSKIVLGCNACNCSSAVHSVLDARGQWLWIGKHLRDSRHVELVHEMRDLCESHAAYSKGIVFGIRRGMRSQPLLSPSSVNRSSTGDEQTTCRLIVMRASTMVLIDIASECTLSVSSKCSFETQTSVLHTIVVPKQVLQSYHMLMARVLIVPAENSDGRCNMGPSGGYHVHKASKHQLVYGQITGFFVGLPLVKLHYHWRGNRPGLGHSELLQGRQNIAVLMDVDRVILPILFNDRAEIEWDTPEIMHPEPLLYLILDLPNQVLIINDKEIIDVQNDSSDYHAVILPVMEHK